MSCHVPVEFLFLLKVSLYGVALGNRNQKRGKCRICCVFEAHRFWAHFDFDFDFPELSFPQIHMQTKVFEWISAD